jgi:hypothetical protein
LFIGHWSPQRAREQFASVFSLPGLLARVQKKPALATERG